MFHRIARKISLFLHPPKKDDVFYGDPLWFVISRPVELVLHNLKDKHGTSMYDPIPSRGCFKFTVSGFGNEFLILKSEVLCRNKFSDYAVWMERTQPRRMAKSMFIELILNGMLWRD